PNPAGSRYCPRRAPPPSTSAPAFPRRRRADEPPPSSTSSPEELSDPRRRRAARRAPAASETSRFSVPQPRVQTTEKAPQNAPEGLHMGPASGLETRYRRRSHSSYRDTGPETGFGGGELTRRRWRSLQRGPDRPTAPLSPHRNSRGW